MYGYGYSLYNRLAFITSIDNIIVKDFQARVIADGGTFEAKQCLVNQLNFLNNINYLPSNYDVNAQAFINASGVTDITTIYAVNDLVISMKADGTWTKMKAIYPFVGGTATTHKFNLKDPRDLDEAFRLTFFGGWTHSSNGVLPNGTNAYADTFLTPSTSLSIDNASLGYYGGNNTGSSIDKATMGSLNGPPFKVFCVIPAYTGIGLFGDVNDGSITSTANTNTSGFIFITRTSSTQKIHSIRGVQTTKTETSTGLPTRKVVIGARNYNTIEFYSAIQHRFTFIGDGLTDTEASNLYTRVQAFQTTLNRQV
jgi:hypothetical protein